MDKTLTIVREWERADSLVGLCRFVSGTAFVAFPVGQLVKQFWTLICGVAVHPAMALQLVVPAGEHRKFIHRYHDSILAGHLGVSRIVFRLSARVYWPGLREDVHSYLANCSVHLARKSP